MSFFVRSIRQRFHLAHGQVEDELSRFLQLAQRELSRAEWEKLMPAVEAAQAAQSVQLRALETLLRSYADLDQGPKSNVVHLRPYGKTAP